MNGVMMPKRAESPAGPDSGSSPGSTSGHCELRYQAHPRRLADVVCGDVHLEQLDPRSAHLAVMTPQGELHVGIRVWRGRLVLRAIVEPKGARVTVDGKAVE